MTINDTEVSEQVSEVHRAASRLDYLMREGQEKQLFLELMAIYRAADKAMDRLNVRLREIK